MSELVGTKERIFDACIELFSTLGYENVTVREIANKVGIKAASIYNHYPSKEQILDEVYDYYWQHYFDTRLPIEDMKKQMETEDAEAFIFAMARNFESDDPKQHVRMILITKLVYMRLFQDEAANALFAKTYADETRYVIETLQHGIAVGRVDPDFDLASFADILIGSMVAMGIRAFANPAYTVGLLEHEERMRSMLSRLLVSGLL